MVGGNFLMDFNYDDEYNCYINAPTLAQAQGWLIREKNYYVSPAYSVYLPQHDWYWSIYDIIKAKIKFNSDVFYNSPEEALSDGITECLRILENNHDD